MQCKTINKTKSIGLRVRQDINNRLDEESKELGISKSEIIHDLIEIYINAYVRDTKVRSFKNG